MKHRSTLTVGIIAHNEEANIAKLLTSLLAQPLSIARLEEVLVYSDGSTDATIAQARSIHDSRIRIFNQKIRLGVNHGLNFLVQKARSDVLVLLDADVLPKDSRFLDNMVSPLQQNSRIGLVSAMTKSLPGKTYVERVIAYSHKLKQAMYQRVQGGNTVYLCHGRARALPRFFYRKLRFPDACPEDAYSYFACLAAGFHFHYAKNAIIYFRSPATIGDHARQSARFLVGISSLSQHFGRKTIQSAYRLPFSILAMGLARAFWHSPFKTLAFCAITLYLRFLSTPAKVHLSKWEASPSTKRLIIA